MESFKILAKTNSFLGFGCRPSCFFLCSSTNVGGGWEPLPTNQLPIFRKWKLVGWSPPPTHPPHTTMHMSVLPPGERHAARLKFSQSRGGGLHWPLSRGGGNYIGHLSGGRASALSNVFKGFGAESCPAERGGNDMLAAAKI